MGDDSKGSKRVLYGMFKIRKKDLAENTIMVDNDGNEVHGRETLTKLWKEYFEDLLNPNGLEDDILGEETQESVEMEKDLTWAEMEIAWAKIKRRKSTWNR